jgi:hypothetical protein
MRRRQGRGIKRAPQPFASAADMGFALLLAALMHERRKPGERGRLLTADGRTKSRAVDSSGRA